MWQKLTQTVLQKRPGMSRTLKVAQDLGVHSFPLRKLSTFVSIQKSKVKNSLLWNLKYIYAQKRRKFLVILKNKICKLCKEHMCVKRWPHRALSTHLDRETLGSKSWRQRWWALWIYEQEGVWPRKMKRYTGPYHQISHWKFAFFYFWY